MQGLVHLYYKWGEWGHGKATLPCMALGSAVAQGVRVLHLRGHPPAPAGFAPPHEQASFAHHRFGFLRLWLQEGSQIAQRLEKQPLQQPSAVSTSTGGGRAMSWVQ